MLRFQLQITTTDSNCSSQLHTYKRTMSSSQPNFSHSGGEWASEWVGRERRKDEKCTQYVASPWSASLLPCIRPWAMVCHLVIKLYQCLTLLNVSSQILVRPISSVTQRESRGGIESECRRLCPSLGNYGWGLWLLFLHLFLPRTKSRPPRKLTTTTRITTLCVTTTTTMQ